MINYQTLADIRRDYGEQGLCEEHLDPNPITQFKQWLTEILSLNPTDSTAMVLSTTDEHGYPDSRIVLLKEIDDEEFVFYTNYNSVKAIQLTHIPYAALNFYWPSVSRQVRVRGHVKYTTPEQSTEYFNSRPRYSQISAIIARQSQEIPNRKFLEDAFTGLIDTSNADPALVQRPDHWGGYRVVPEVVEFWQGRNNRLHDRIQYRSHNGVWDYHRLAP